MAMANVVELGQQSKNKKRKHFEKDSHSGMGPKGSIKKIKFQGKCCKCDKLGHRVAECRSKPNNFNEKPLANITKVKTLSDDVSNLNLSVVMSEINLGGSNTKE